MMTHVSSINISYLSMFTMTDFIYTLTAKTPTRELNIKTLQLIVSYQVNVLLTFLNPLNQTVLKQVIRI